MKSEIRKHLLPLLVILVVISAYWFPREVVWYQYIFLFLGLSLGSFFLDLDHLLYWLYLNPNIEESRLAQVAARKYDFMSLLKLLESTHKKHTSLIFHHFFFQVVLALISFFVFTSSDNVFIMAFLLALNIHLIIDELDDYQNHRTHLQEWLFARETKQLPQSYLSKYIATFTVFSTIFFILLLRSK